MYLKLNRNVKKMKTITIKDCSECPTFSHTGAFTKGGSKPCCNHNDTVKEKGYDCNKRVIPYKTLYDNTPIIKVPKGIPNWCPL